MAYGGALQEKNVSHEMLDGKVGRMYVPRQEIGSIATRKMKVNHLLASPALRIRDCCTARNWCAGPKLLSNQLSSLLVHVSNISFPPELLSADSSCCLCCASGAEEGAARGSIHSQRAETAEGWC